MGPTAHDFLRQLDDEVDIVALVETHVVEEQLPKWRGVLQADGWKLAATPGVFTKRSAAGSHGGEWVLSRLGRATTTFEGQRRFWKTGDPLFYGFCPMVVHLRAGNLVLISLYWLPGEGLEGDNLDRVRSVSRFVQTLADPWIILGDFNMPPEALLASGWPEQINGCIITPAGVEGTCDQGQ